MNTLVLHSTQISRFEWQLAEENEVFLVGLWQVFVDPSFSLQRKHAILYSIAYRLNHLLRWHYQWGKVRAEIYGGYPAFAVMLNNRQEIPNLQAAIKIIKITDNLVVDQFEVRESAENCAALI